MLKSKNNKKKNKKPSSNLENFWVKLLLSIDSVRTCPVPRGKRTQDRAFTGVTKAPLAKIRALRMEAPNLKYDGVLLGGMRQVSCQKGRRRTKEG